MRYRRPQRRAIGLWNGDESPENMSSRAQYVGSQEHKSHPGPAGPPNGEVEYQGQDLQGRSSRKCTERRDHWTRKWRPCRIARETGPRRQSVGWDDVAVPVRMPRGLDRKRATAEAAMNRFLEESGYAA